MEKQSIAFKLSIYVILVVSTVITLVVYLNYDFSKKILMQNIEEAAINQSGLIIDEIESNLVVIQEVSRNVVTQAPYYLSKNDLDLFLKGVIRTNKLVYSLHAEVNLPEPDQAKKTSFSIIRSNGKVKLSQDQYFFMDDHFLEIIENLGKEGKWSKPFYDKNEDNNLLISYFQRISTPNHGNVGFLSSEMSLNFLDKIVSDSKVGRRGFSFIVSGDGKYITHPVKEWIMQRNIFDVSEEIFVEDIDSHFEILKEKGSVSGYAYPELLDFEKAWFYAAKIPYTDWLIITAVPYNELFKDLDVILKKIILISAAGILFVLLIILLLFKQMLSPLMQMIQSIQKLSFGERIRKGKKNELQLLNESLDAFQQQYHSFLKKESQRKKDRKKYERDLKSAKEIQTFIIPSSDPKFPKEKRIELYAELHPAESIGGDLYDYFFIDSKHLLFSMGDVSGKGIPAALFMAVAHTMIKSKSTVLSASQIVELVNKELSKQNINQNFITLFIGILNIDTGELTYCNAAHSYPYIIRDESNIEVLDVTHGLPLGVYANKNYLEDKLVLQKNDSIILYTDGVTDCKDTSEQTYSSERFVNNLGLLLDLRPKEMIKRLMKSLKLFKGGTKPTDDISFMVVRYLGK